ncbi:hypothetical protein T4B_13006 [Trichinella pseudospiralis]|uniref:Uncharacterized protein n=1 Tax=Trichinella pseudospiralis TaxID=6337 RepID=A0A0V1GA29_TRIPS|nr:hypothetical protein T4B_13006 [Trichinella pseudospiralis]
MQSNTRKLLFSGSVTTTVASVLSKQRHVYQ